MHGIAYICIKKIMKLLKALWKRLKLITRIVRTGDCLPPPTDGVWCAFQEINQQDVRWGNEYIGDTLYLIRDFGCLISSISALSFSCCTNITPDILARELDFNNNGELLWNSITQYERLGMEFMYRYYYVDFEKMQEILYSDDRVCCIEVPAGTGRHWMALTGWDNGHPIAYDGYREEYVNVLNIYNYITGFAELKNVYERKT
jgi:hypothetical protein